MIYVVAPGDTLSGIARLSGSSVAQLQQNNGILPDQPLVPGQALVVPDRDGTASEKPLLSVGGYAYPHIRPGVLQQALPFLTTLSIFSYGFREDGTLVEPSARWLLQQAGEVGAGAVLVLTSTDEDGNFSSQRAAQLFRDRVLQTQVLDSLLQVLIEKGYVGWMLILSTFRKRIEMRFLHFWTTPENACISMAFSFRSIWPRRPMPSSRVFSMWLTTTR